MTDKCVLPVMPKPGLGRGSSTQSLRGDVTIQAVGCSLLQPVAAGCWLNGVGCE